MSKITSYKLNKTYTFQWVGINLQGKKIRGEIKTSSISLVKLELRRQGIVPKRVKRKNQIFTYLKYQKVKALEITTFSRQLATLLEAGIPLVQAFESIIRGTNNVVLRNLISTLKTDVESGSSLTEALKKHPEYFNSLYINLIDSGEKSGSLDIMLDKIATYKERIESIKGKIKKALFYPTTVIIVALGVTIGLLVFVVPQFETLFNTYQGNLPWLTQIVIKLSRHIQNQWWLIALSILTFCYVIYKLKKSSPTFNFLLDKLSLKLPIVGNIMTKASVARFTRTLSITFAAGLPLVDSLKSIAGVTGNQIITQAILKAREEVSSGLPLNQALAQRQIVPHMAVQMIAIGEETAQLESMLSKISDYYEEEVDQLVDGMSNLIEPLLMVILGIVVGGLVVAMYLPIFKMGNII